MNSHGACGNFKPKMTLSKASASFVSSSLTTRVSLLSLSDKSTADVVECADVDCAPGSFCSSCFIAPHMARGLWSSGNGCAMCNYDDNCGGSFGFSVRYLLVFFPFGYLPYSC